MTQESLYSRRLCEDVSGRGVTWRTRCKGWVGDCRSKGSLRDHVENLLDNLGKNSAKIIVIWNRGGQLKGQEVGILV